MGGRSRFLPKLDQRGPTIAHPPTSWQFNCMVPDPCLLSRTSMVPFSHFPDVAQLGYGRALPESFLISR